jgi:hypothetical protein
MVLEKRKTFMQKSGTKRSLFRMRLRLLHVVLDVILIVCLVFLLFGSINLVFSFDVLFGLTWHMLTHVDYKISRL